MDGHCGNDFFCMDEAFPWRDLLCGMSGSGSFVSVLRDGRENWGGGWMVFYRECLVFDLKGMSAYTLVRNVLLQHIQSGLCGFWDYEQKTDWREKISLSSVFASGRTVACALADLKVWFYPASFTVEAALVLSVVFLAIAALIRHALCVHDMVSGSMILEEMVEKIRFRKDGDEWENVYEAERRQASGTAKAGGWEGQIYMKRFQPETFLRQMEAMLEIGDVMDAGEDGV